MRRFHTVIFVDFLKTVLQNQRKIVHTGDHVTISHIIQLPDDLPRLETEVMYAFPMINEDKNTMEHTFSDALLIEFFLGNTNWRVLLFWKKKNPFFLSFPNCNEALIDCYVEGNCGGRDFSKIGACQDQFQPSRDFSSRK